MSIQTLLRRMTGLVAAIAALLIACLAPASSVSTARRPSQEIVLSFAGDCTFGAVNGDRGPGRFPTVLRQSRQADYPFARVKPYLQQDDLSVVNCEGTFTQAVKTADKQWHFKGDARDVSLFAAGSVEAVSLANNHSHDYLQQGFQDTLSAFEKAHEPVFYQNKPFVTTVRGIRVIVIGDCTVTGENTTTLDGVSGRVLRQIARYKRPGSIIVVFMHWGSELAAVPFAWQRQMARTFVDAGADGVVGCHPHVLQGMEVYKGKPIAYSLGNFAFGGNSHARYPQTVILRLRFAVAGANVQVRSISIIPCRATSAMAKNATGVFVNNYQPCRVYGKEAAQTTTLFLARSAGLPCGVRRITY